jgi:hypothetical protein
MKRTKPIEIIPFALSDSFLANPLRLSGIKQTMAALAKERPDATYDEKRVREWLEIPGGKDERLYTDDEKARLIEGAVPEVRFSLTSNIKLRPEGRNPRMDVVFGAPGTGKTTLAYTLAGNMAVTVDVKQVQKEIGLYQDAMRRYGNSGILGAVTANVYGHWGASYIGTRMIGDLLPEYDVVYSAASPYPVPANFYDMGKRTGVHIPLHMVFAPEAVRAGSCRKRWEEPNGDNMPVPRLDVIEKNRNFMPMIRLHFETAAEGVLYWRDAVDAPAEQVATAEKGSVEILSHAKKAHKAMIEEIQRHKPDFDWQKDVVKAHALSNAGRSSFRSYPRPQSLLK